MKPKRPSDYPWPVTAHHASFIEDFTNAMDSRPITPTTASDSAMTTPPTATPRTDAAVIASGFQAVPFGFQDFARTLETELAAAKAECERLARQTDLAEKELRIFKVGWKEDHAELATARSERDLAITRVASILWSGAIDKHTCGDVQQWVTDYTADLARLRAEVERLKGALALGQENCDSIYNDMREERTELYARAERAEADTARLDWLERNGRFGYKAGTVWSDYFAVDLSGGEKTTLRAAIDAAMKGTP